MQGDIWNTFIGLRLMPGAGFHVCGGANTMLIKFSYLTTQDNREGTTCLGLTLKEFLHEKVSAN